MHTEMDFSLQRPHDSCSRISALHVVLTDQFMLLCILLCIVPMLSPWYQLHFQIPKVNRKVGKVQDCMTLNKSAPKGCYFTTHAVPFIVTEHNLDDIPCPRRPRGQRSIVLSVSQGTEESRYWLAQHDYFQVHTKMLI